MIIDPYRFTVASGADPTTGVGGLSFSTITPSQFDLVSSSPDTDDTGLSFKVTMNGGSSSFHTAAPSGFTAWDSSVAWDSVSKHSSTVLTNSNRTAEHLFTGPQDSSVKGTVSKSSGKFYFEMTINALPSVSFLSLVGLVNSSAWTNISRSSAQGVVIAPDGKVYVQSGSSSITYSSFTVSDSIQFAVDISNKLLWIRKNGGSWNI